MIGEGAEQMMVNVAQIPNVGDTITVRSNQVLRAITDAAFHVESATYLVVARYQDVDHVYDLIPWFGVQIIE